MELSNLAEKIASQTPMAQPPTIWLVKDGEPLPIDENPRLFRTALLAKELESQGCQVCWFASRFDHAKKRFRVSENTYVRLSDRYLLYLLDGPGYKTNISLSRIRHQSHLAKHFSKVAALLPKPDLVVATYPSPELCFAACQYAHQHGIPLYVDVRDPWPDSFAEYFPTVLRFGLFPLLLYYRRLLRKSARLADGILSMSNAMFQWALTYAGRKERESDHMFYLGYNRSTSPREISLPEKFSEGSPLTCIFVGMFGKSYDGAMIIEAARFLEMRGEKRIRFLIVGDGPLRKVWEKRAKGLSSLTFTGWLGERELQRYLRQSHVGIIAVRGGITRFWMGNKLFEYASQSLAILNTASGEPKTVIEKNGLGTTIPVGDEKALAKVLTHYTNNPLFLREHMEHSRNIFEAEFEATALYKRYATHILTALEKPANKAVFNA